MATTTTEDGLKLHYRLDGPEGARVVLFSNSLGSDMSLWDGQVAGLTDRFRVLRYDTRGHGGSDAPAGDYVMESLARDVLGLLDHLGLDRVSFCVISMGGAIGQWLGSHAPERFDRLILANTGALFGTPQLWQQRLDAVLEGGMTAVVEGVLDRWFTPDYRAAHPAEAARVRAMLLAVPPQGYAGCCAALRDTDFRRFLPRVAVPTLVIAGEHDAASPPEKGQELARGIPGARLAMLDAAHLSVLEQPRVFSARLREFLD